MLRKRKLLEQELDRVRKTADDARQEADSYIQAVQLLAQTDTLEALRTWLVQAVFCDPPWRVPLRQKTELMQLLAEIEIYRDQKAGCCKNRPNNTDQEC